MKTMLKIPAITGKVHLGCSAEERKKAQTVNIGIEIRFQQPPKALKTDKIDHTPCYAEMSALLQKCFVQKEYATIENLCFECHKALKKYIKSKVKKAVLQTTVHKLAPPIAEIIGGSHFQIEQNL